MLYMMIATAEVPIPSAVLYNASEIPFENSAAASPPPSSPRAAKRTNHTYHRSKQTDQRSY